MQHTTNPNNIISCASVLCAAVLGELCCYHPTASSLLMQQLQQKHNKKTKQNKKNKNNAVWCLQQNGPDALSSERVKRVRLESPLYLGEKKRRPCVAPPRLVSLHASAPCLPPTRSAFHIKTTARLFSASIARRWCHIWPWALGLVLSFSKTRKICLEKKRKKRGVGKRSI